jgi:hypothetical protein
VEASEERVSEDREREDKADSGVEGVEGWREVDMALVPEDDVVSVGY